MTGDTFIAVNHRIEAERRAKYCGRASIRVASLRFRDATHAATKSQKNAETLKRIFLEERGCRREDSRHHAKALVSKETLEAALAKSGLSVTSLLEDGVSFPQLSLPDGVSLQCIQGRDRLTAADEVLQGQNKRWVVDLFLDDLSEELERLLIEDYEYQKRPDDGEIYVKIREYQGVHGQANAFFERMWLGRLAVSENRRKNFDQLSRHRKFAAAFDALLSIPALFGGFRLSVVHQLISMRCDETMRQIDRPTVEAVEGKAPGACKADHDELFAKFRSGHIFDGVPRSRRERLWTNMCNTSKKFLIPSLFTFFEDRKYLALAADCLRRLVDVGPRDTIVGRLEDSFTDANQQSDRAIIQISSTSFGTIPGDAGTRVDFGIRQLWLAALREHRDLPADPRKRGILANARPTADNTTLYELANLAYRIGFESDKIGEILRNAPDRQIAERALLTARKPGRYRYHDQERCIQQMVDIFATAATQQETESLEVPDVGEPVRSPRRQGVPHDLDHERDKVSLFFPYMESAVEDEQTKISSSFIRKSMYFAYFGEPPSTRGCVPSSEPAGRDVDMTDETHDPAAYREPNRVNLDLSMIRRGLNSERCSSADEPDPVDADDLSFEDLTPATQDERINLDRLRDLALAEQTQIDKKRIALNLLVQEEQERLGRLDQLAERETEAQARLDRLLETLREEENRQRERHVVVREDVVAANVRSEAGEDHVHEDDPSETQVIVGSRRNHKRGTQFAFGRLLEDESRGEEQEAGASSSVSGGGASSNASSNAPKVRIIFKERQIDGGLRITDTLDVDPAHPSQVERVAGKYARKGYVLFDVHDTNLKARNCFRHVTSNGSNIIILKASSRGGDVITRERDKADVGEQEGKKLRPANTQLSRIEE